METQARVCSECNSHLENIFSFIQPPNILALSFPQSNLHTDTEFLMKVEHNDYQYILRGIIYFGADHFTSRIITDQTLIWYHDGIETAADVDYKGTIGNVQDLNTCRGKKLLLPYIHCSSLPTDVKKFCFLLSFRTHTCHA